MKKYILAEGGCYNGEGCVAKEDNKLCYKLKQIGDCTHKRFILNPEWKPISQRVRELDNSDNDKTYYAADKLVECWRSIDKLARELEQEEKE